MKNLLAKLKEPVKLYLTLLLLSWVRLKMYLAAKKYAKDYPNGTIEFLSDYREFDLSHLNQKKLLLFVVYKPKLNLMYERYFQFLEKLGSNIIVISNGKLDKAFSEAYKDKVILFGERYNIGRDFGVYKEFIQLLKAKNIQPKELIICNDSMFANLKKNDSRFIDFIHKSENDDFVGAAEYFGQPNYHVQSYFLKFSNKVLNGKNFTHFWENFFITDNRRDNIHNGEVKLSQAIFSDGFTPRVFLSTDMIIDKITSNKEILFKFLSEISANSHTVNSSPHFNNKWRLLHGTGEYKLSIENYALEMEILKIDISYLISRSGIIGIIPFLIIDELGFPFLKRDLVYREVTNWMLIRQFAKNFDPDIIDEYIDDQRLRKRPWLLSLKEKAMYRSGII